MEHQTTARRPSSAPHLSRFRSYLPKIGLLILIALLSLDLYHRDWDFSRPSFVKGSTEFYLIALLCMAIGPGFAIGVYLYYKDRYYDESWSLLGRLFLFGILFAPLAGLGEIFFGYLFDYSVKKSTVTEHFIFMFFVVALFEELVKFGAVRKIAYHTKAFKQVYDGVLFCAASALGFATVENIIYVFTGGEFAIGVALVRAMSAVPGHICSGVIMGYGMGKAKTVEGRPKEKEWMALGLAGAVFFHGAYNFSLTFRFKSWSPLFFLAIMIGEWVVAYLAMKKGLRYTPFTYCRKCRRVIPQLASYCPFCGTGHSIVLKCWNCGTDVTKWTRRCGRCSVRMRFPWHLQPRRIKDLFVNRSLVPCPSCEEEIPSGIGVTVQIPLGVEGLPAL